jgi:TRAP-type C4-dicarboxylate transport system substrate-binding protein
VLYDLKKWNALPGWAQDIIKESVKESYEWALTDAAAADKRNIATLEENGVTFYLIPEAEWPEWTKAGKVGWDHIAERDKENGAAILKAVEQTR